VKRIPLWGKLLGGIALLAAACAGLSFVPTGEVAYAPVAPVDLEGKVQIGARPAEPLTGGLFLVGVAERRVNLLQRMLLDVGDPNVDFGPAPAGGQATGPPAEDVAAMMQAKEIAAGVAFDLLERGSVEWSAPGGGATVTNVAPGGPAEGALEPGDFVVRIDGRNVDTSVEASRALSVVPPNRIVKIGIIRAGVASVVKLRTVAPEVADADHRSRVGVELSTLGLRIKLPRPVTIDSGEVVGPSAGLAFALYVYDAIAGEDLLLGRQVVATGSLSPDGRVIEVGRIRQKAVAAQAANRDLLIVPAANLAEARQAIVESCGEGVACVQVVPVRTVREARDVLLDPAALEELVAAPGVPAAGDTSG